MPYISKMRARASFIALASAFLAAPAFAGSDGSIETVVVTAQRYKVDDAATGTKTNTPIIETPVSIEVIPQQVLQDQQIIHLDDALQNVSGVILSNDSYGSGDSFTIRGFDQQGVTYEDGLKLDQYTVSGFPVDIANVEKIEVVKGPASVLYGQAEPGGLVSIVTKKPLDTPYYAFDQQIGSYALYRTTLDATGPLTSDKTLLYRVNLDYQNDGSFRDFITTHRFSIFPTLAWKPNDRNELIAEFKYGTGSQILDNGIPFLSNGTPANVPLSSNYADPGTNKAPTDEYALKLMAQHEFSPHWKLRIVYRGEYIDGPVPHFVVYTGDADNTGLLQRFGFTEDHFQHWTQQVITDVTGQFETYGLKHTLIAGFDHYRLNGNYDANFYLPAPINIYAPVYGQPFTPPDPANDFYVKESEIAYGAYVQDQVEFPYHIHLLAGFRYDNATTYDSGYGNAASKVHDTPAPTPRVGLLWQATPQFSVYGSYTSNYGASPLGSLTADGKLLPAESAKQFEVGAKSELFDKRLSITASVYQLTKYNIPTADPANPAFVIAIGEARSRGVELDVVGEILPGWHVIGGYSYIDAVTTQDNNTPSLAGMSFPGIPRNSGSVWSTYELQNGDLKGLTLGAGVIVRSGEQAYESPTGVSYLADRIPGYAIVNAMIGDEVKIEGKAVRLQLNVTNLFDKKYYAAVIPSQATPGQPFTVIGSIQVRE